MTRVGDASKKMLLGFSLKCATGTLFEGGIRYGGLLVSAFTEWLLIVNVFHVSRLQMRRKRSKMRAK